MGSQIGSDVSAVPLLIDSGALAMSLPKACWQDCEHRTRGVLLRYYRGGAGPSPSHHIYRASPRFTVGRR